MTAHKPAAGNAGIAPRLAIEQHWPGVPEPGERGQATNRDWRGRRDQHRHPSERSHHVSILEAALRRLWDPPPNNLSERVFVTDRNDLSAQIRGQLSASTSEIVSLSDTVARHDRGQSELRDLTQRLLQLRGDGEAQERGNQLRERRGKLTTELEITQRRLRDVIAEIHQLDTKLTADRADESKQRAVVDKQNKGRTIASRAQRYLKAVGQIREQAAIQLREQIAEMVGELWVEIAERSLEFRGMEFDPRWQCSLVRRNGQLAPWEQVNTSAGQKQVRILAFTEAPRPARAASRRRYAAWTT